VDLAHKPPGLDEEWERRSRGESQTGHRARRWEGLLWDGGEKPGGLHMLPAPFLDPRPAGYRPSLPGIVLFVRVSI
jgi:hypothetical protein